MGLRRGFKSEAHTIARDIRRELGLGTAAPLNPWALAAHLGIPVVGISSMADEVRQAVAQLTRKYRSAFSAVTVFYGYKRMIVVNDSHATSRQASDIAHELAHALLWHVAGATFDGDGVREWNPTQEAEAQWLGGALLISEEAALLIARQRLSPVAAAARYEVSPQMLRYRLRVTGALTRVERAARYRQLSPR
jgi:Zn-dependent peptidase ImmA (M78 family)